VVTVVYTLYRWLVPAPEIRAHMDVPETAVGSPIAGVVQTQVRVGQSVQSGDLLAVVEIPCPEHEERDRELAQLTTEIEALEQRQIGVRARLTLLGALRRATAESQDNLQRASLVYGLARDYGFADFTASTDHAARSARLVSSLAERTAALNVQGSAAVTELTETEIRELASRMSVEAAARDQERSEQLKEAMAAWQDAQCHSREAAENTPTAEEIQDMRLLGAIDLDLTVRRARLAALSQMPTGYEVKAPHAGIVTQVTDKTQVTAAAAVVSVTHPTAAVLVIRAPYGAMDDRLADGGSVRFRLVRTSNETCGNLVAIRRGVTQQDRTLKSFDLVEYVVRLRTEMSDLVPGEIAVSLP